MAATVVVAAGTMMIGTKSTTTPPKLTTATPTKPSPTFLSLQNLPKGLAFATHPRPSLPYLTSSAVAAVVFSSLSSADAAFAVQHIADIADGDSRGIALLIPIVPAIGWVLYNILQPALNQINKMRSVKGIAIGLGLGLGFGLDLTSAPIASAGEVVTIAEAASGDNRGLLLLVPVAVAIAWVLFNILQPALNQLNKMRERKVEQVHQTVRFQMENLSRRSLLLKNKELELVDFVNQRLQVGCIWFGSSEGNIEAVKKRALRDAELQDPIEGFY